MGSEGGSRHQRRRGPPSLLRGHPGWGRPAAVSPLSTRASGSPTTPRSSTSVAAAYNTNVHMAPLPICAATTAAAHATSNIEVEVDIDSTHEVFEGMPMSVSVYNSSAQHLGYRRLVLFMVLQLAGATVFQILHYTPVTGFGPVNMQDRVIPRGQGCDQDRRKLSGRGRGVGEGGHPSLPGGSATRRGHPVRPRLHLPLLPAPWM